MRLLLNLIEQQITDGDPRKIGALVVTLAMLLRLINCRFIIIIIIIIIKYIKALLSCIRCLNIL